MPKRPTSSSATLEPSMGDRVAKMETPAFMPGRTSIARQIMMGYRLRWAVALFHKNIKQFLGFEDVSTSGFDSVKSHVYWVYWAYMLGSSSLLVNETCCLLA